MLKVSILTIGDEICIGQIINTNASWLASECVKQGCSVVLHSSVGDEKEIIKNELERLSSLSDFVIVTGGLGPTHDDITKSTLLEYFEDEYIFNQEVADELEKRFKLRRFAFTERNKAQALLPSKCKVLTNAVGTAPGMLFQKEGKYIVSLPGVPREMMYIVTTHVLPLLNELLTVGNHNVFLYKNLMTNGIPESMLADLIGKPEDFLDGGSLAFLPSYKGVRLRIGVSAENKSIAEEKIEKIENIIRSRAGRFIYGVDEDSLTKKTGDLLKLFGKTVSVAESCTGGMLGAELTEISGSSDYFSGGMIVYSNEIKIKQLNIDENIIREHGAVSKETCEAMALNVRKKLKTDFGISITGIAGPTGGTDEKPVGTVWIGISDEDGVDAKMFSFSPDRKINRERAVGTAINLLYKKLTEND